MSHVSVFSFHFVVRFSLAYVGLYVFVCATQPNSGTFCRQALFVGNFMCFNVLLPRKFVEKLKDHFNF